MMMHTCLMTANDRQSVTKWVSHFSLPHKGNFYLSFPTKELHAETAVSIM